MDRPGDFCAMASDLLRETGPDKVRIKRIVRERRAGKAVDERRGATEGEVAGSERIRAGTDHGPGTGVKSTDEPLHLGCI